MLNTHQCLATRYCSIPKRQQFNVDWQLGHFYIREDTELTYLCRLFLFVSCKKEGELHEQFQFTYITHSRPPSRQMVPLIVCLYFILCKIISDTAACLCSAVYDNLPYDCGASLGSNNISERASSLYIIFGADHGEKFLRIQIEMAKFGETGAKQSCVHDRTPLQIWFNLL